MREDIQTTYTTKQEMMQVPQEDREKLVGRHAMLTAERDLYNTEHITRKNITKLQHKNITQKI